jgi:integrase
MSVHKQGNAWAVCERIKVAPGQKPKQVWYRPGPCGFENSKAGAELFEAQMKVDRAKGTYCEPTTITVSEYADRWMRVYVERNCQPNTVESYEYFLRVHIKPALGSCRLANLRPVDVEEFYCSLKRADGKGDLAPQTKHDVHRVLNGMLNHAVEMEVIPRNPVKKKLIPKKVKTEKHCYTKEQVIQILETAKDTTLHLPIFLAFHTGMRIGEICALKWADVTDRNITVQRSMEQTTGSLREKCTKTGKGRNIQIGDVLSRVLVQHRAEQSAHRLRTPGWKANDLVFPNNDGTPRHPEAVSQMFQKLVQTKTELPYYSFHALRHSHVSVLIGQGWHPKQIQDRVGHSSISMTMDTYGHLFDGTDTEAAEKLDRAFGS